MADTVKKSRIVSEPDTLVTFGEDEASLQDIMNQEFNERLKSMIDEPFIEATPDHIPVTLDQNEIIKNGDLKPQEAAEPAEAALTLDLKSKTTDVFVLTSPKHNGNVENIEITEKIEEDLKPNGLSSSPTHISPRELIPDDNFINKEIPSPEDEIEAPFENITVTDVDTENLTAKERFLSTVKDIPELEDDKKTIKDRMLLSTDSACLLFTQTVVQSPMLTPTDENYDFLQGITQNTTTPKVEEIVPNLENLVLETEDEKDVSEISAENEICHQESSNSDQDISENIEDIKNITLHFIQNEIDNDLSKVNESYLLTPTIVEHLVEDIDPDEQNDEYMKNITSSAENVETIDSNVETSESVVETIDSNVEISEGVVETIDSNVETSESIVETIETNVETLEGVVETTEEINKTIDSIPSLDSPEKIPPTVEQTSSPIEETNSSPTNVKEISKIFSDKSEESKEDIIKSPVLEETFEDIQKTREFFEKIDSPRSEEKIFSSSVEYNDDDDDVDDDDTNNECSTHVSTTVTSESSFVETRTETNSNQDKVLKKKKSKKSKKDNEKENISVCDLTSSNEDDNLSHVSVKNLCRSFSDLTSIANRNGDKLKRISYGRTKSMSDIRRDEGRYDNVFSNVSVKNLRECFDNLTNRTNICFEKKSVNNQIKPILKTTDRIEKLKSSFSKFDALQKKTVLHVRSADAGKAQEKFNGNAVQPPTDLCQCKSCGKQVFQMEQIKAEKAIWHKNCFRCTECNKQLNVDTYQSNEGVLYCKPHFKALFTPKAVEDDPQPIRPRKHELIIRENQPEELPPDVVRASDKPDLGLDELQNLNVKERFQVFEQHDNLDNSLERTPSTVNVKRSPSILSKLAKFQSKGMDIGVADESLNGIPVEESSSEEEEEEEEIEGEDAELVRARRAQREKPMHFSNMSDVVSKWESGNQMTREERREERKQEIQSIRSRLFMGKQAKIKEMYQQAVADSSSGAHVKKQISLDTELSESARSLRERFERGEQLSAPEQQTLRDADDAAVFEAASSRQSRTIFLQLDANASKAPTIQPAVPGSKSEVRRAREAFMNRTASSEVVRASDQLDDVEVKTADISSRFQFFETYKEPEKQRKAFRITPPRDPLQVKMAETPDETPAEEELLPEPDTVSASEAHTATRMLSVFRQLEAGAGKDAAPAGPKPLKRFTPPPEPPRNTDTDSEQEYTEEEDEDEVDNDEEGGDDRRVIDEDLIEAQKAARAKQLRAKFEKWEASEIKREQNNSSVNIAEEIADHDSQIESAKSLRARFESMKESNTDKERTPRVKVNRFVDTTNTVETCRSCEGRVYPLEKVSCHNNVYHKNCFRCRECNTVLRMDSYTYNQGLLYCLPHFKRLFIAKGNYEAGFGLDPHKDKWNNANNAVV